MSESDAVQLTLFDLPDDCLALIVGHMHLTAVASFARTCHRAHEFLAEPDAWLALCRVRDLHVSDEAVGDAAALRDVLRMSLFCIDRATHSDGVVVAEDGRSAWRTSDTADGFGFYRARSVNVVPMDDRVHVYRVRFTLPDVADGPSARLAENWLGAIGVAQPRFARFEGSGFNRETQSVGQYTGGSTFVGDTVGGNMSYESVDSDKFTTAQSLAVHEVHVRIKPPVDGATTTVAYVRCALVDVTVPAGEKVPLSSALCSPPPEGVFVSSTATIDGSSNVSFACGPPWHVVFMLCVRQARLQLLGTTSFAPAGPEGLDVILP